MLCVPNKIGTERHFVLGRYDSLFWGIAALCFAIALGLTGGEPCLKIHMSVKIIVCVHASISCLLEEFHTFEYDKGASAHLGTLTPLRPT